MLDEQSIIFFFFELDFQHLLVAFIDVSIKHDVNFINIHIWISPILKK